MVEERIVKRIGPYKFIYGLSKREDKWEVTKTSIDETRPTILSVDAIAQNLFKLGIVDRVANQTSKEFQTIEEAKGELKW
jgi:hypothetical protein